MCSPSTTVKVVMIRVVEFVETVQDVLGRMTVYYVKQHGYTHAMSRIYELSQVVWVTVAAAGGEETVDLIPETGIVRVFHDCHELDDIVAEFVDSRECIVSELLVCCDFHFW